MKLIARRLKSRWASVALLLAIIGPGIITANVDNDAGGITTYSLAGGNFGYRLLWVLIPVTVALVIIQEMCARMGAITGKGLSDLIRERFGLRLTFWVMLGVALSNLTNTMAEFAGVASASEIFGLSRYIAVPLAGIAVWFIVVKGSYRRVEKVFLVACTFYVSYILSGFMARPDWAEMGRQIIHPTLTFDGPTIMMAIGIVGTTIAPWMQFYQQASVVDKGIRARDYRFTVIDVVVGCAVAVATCFFIVATCAATIFHSGQHVTTVEAAAQALRPLAGPYCAGLFAFGLLNASLFAASILPLSTTYLVCEGMGWERGVNRSFAEAPEFYSLYTGMIVVGAGIVLLPRAPLLTIMYLSQVLNGILLPAVLIFILILINDRRLMGEYRNNRFYNAVSITTVVIMTGLTVLLALTTVWPGLLGGG
ncbi:Nramp family divalent metal transporter [bacterium]|nr:Nramp family divalent metal transporter [bacterium]